MLITRNVQGTGDLYSAQCQFHLRRPLPADEFQKQCMQTLSCEDRDVSCVVSRVKALVTRMSCQTVLYQNISNVSLDKQWTSKQESKEMDQSSEMDRFTSSAPVGWLQYRTNARCATDLTTQTHQKRASSIFALRVTWTLGPECYGQEPLQM